MTYRNSWGPDFLARRRHAWNFAGRSHGQRIFGMDLTSVGGSIPPAVALALTPAADEFRVPTFLHD